MADTPQTCGRMSAERGWRRRRTPVSGAVAVAVVAIAVPSALANVALQGSTGEESIGRLSPVTESQTPAVTVPATSDAEPPGVTTTDRDDHCGAGSGGQLGSRARPR